MVDKNFWVNNNTTKKADREFWVGKEATKPLPTAQTTVSTTKPSPVVEENPNRNNEIKSRMAELDTLMKETDTKIRRIGYTEAERAEFQSQYKTYKDEYYKLKNELKPDTPAVVKAPVKLDPNVKLTAGNPNPTFGDKAANFFHATLPTAAQDLWDDIKYPFTGPSARQLLTEAKLSPELLKQDAEIQLAKDDPTWRDYALIKPTKEIVKTYGMEDSNIKAISGDNTQLLKDLERAEKTYQASPIDATLANAGAAGMSILGDVAGFANMLGADKIPVIKNLTASVIDTADKLQANAQQYNVGTYGGYMGNLTQVITRMIPYFIAGTGKVVTEGGKAAKLIASTVNNPSFWISLTTIAGQKYNENMANGVNRWTATLNALTTAIPSALIEIAGGVGAKGKEAQSLLTTILEENFEEIAQGIVEKVSDKLTTKPDMKLYSTTEEAIINPKQMGEEVLYTTPATLLTGGASRVIQNSQTAKLNKEIEEMHARYQTKKAMDDYKRNSQYAKYQPQQINTQISSKDIKPRVALPEGGKIYVDPQGVAVDSRNYVAPRQETIQTEETKKKNELINKINNNAYLPEEEKINLINQVNDSEYTEEFANGMELLLKNVDEEFGLKNISNNFKDNKAKYGEYLRDETEYDKTQIDNAKNSVAANKSGRRTKEQWLQVAKNLGSQIYEMSDAEIEKLAYKTWMDNKPNNKENLNRQGQKYVKFGLDEWVNTVYDEVKKYRAANPTQKVNNKLPTQAQNVKYSPVNAKQVMVNPLQQENAVKNAEVGKNVAPESSTNAFQEQGKQTILPTQKIQETVNSAKIAGMSDFDVEKAKEIHKMLQSGTKLKFYNPQNIPEGVNPEKASRANGFFQDGVLWLNKNSDRKVQKIIGHELTHYLEDTQVYKDFSESILKSNLFYDYITSEGFDNVEQFKDNLRRRGYKDHELEYEMVSIFVEDNLFDSQEKINRLARENRTLTQKILNWLSDLRTKLVGTSQDKELLRIENMYRTALEQARGNEQIDTKVAGKDPAFSMTETDVKNYLEKNSMELRANGSLVANNLTDKQIKDLVKIYKANGYEDVSTDYLVGALQRGSAFIPREVADVFIEKQLGYKPQYDTTKIYEDAEGNKLTKEQVEFYKDSAVRDIRGRLIPVYHRTDSEFYTFDKNASARHGKKYGQGFYFSITPENYGNREMKVYLNAKEGEFKYVPKQGYYIVQEPNQIKNVDNTKPTENADIRFSLNDPVEETKDLVALHNLTEDKLKGILDLDGFPVPSIAISKADIPHTAFGDITIVFGKDTIDPTNKYNEVYDRDVYSPRFPQVDVEVNEKLLNDIDDLFPYDSKDDYLMRVRNDYLDMDNARNKIDNRGVDGYLNEIKNDDKFKYAYLKMNNPDFTYEYKNKYTDKETTEYDRFLEEYYKTNSKPLNELTYDEAKALIPIINEAKKGTLTKEITDEGLTGELVDKYVKELSLKDDDYAKADQYIYKVAQYEKALKRGDTKTIDKDKTNEKINKEINQAEYEAWVDEQFENIALSKGIRNNKDIFTSSGNRRSWKQLHDNYSLENIVRYMTSQATTGSESGFMGKGFGNIASQQAKKYKSVDEIRSDKGKLRQFEDEHTELQKYQDELYDDVSELGKYHNALSSDDWQTTEVVSDTLFSFAKGKTQNISNLIKELKADNFDTDKIPTELLEKTVKDIVALKDIPTQYFEAKPQRAVGFDEVLAAVVPKDTDASIKSRLQEKGVNVIEYDSSVEDDRLRAVNSVKDAKFSLNAKEETSNTRSTSHSLLDEIAPINESKLEDVEEEKVANILTRTPKTKAKDMLKQSKDVLMRKFVDAGHTIDTVGKITGDKNLYQYFNNTKQARQSAEYMIGEAQTDIQGNRVGNSLIRVFEPIRAKGDEYTNKFFEYLLHMHNIDRMKQNKPVFGKSVTAEDSSLYVKQLLKEYPEFEKAANKVYAYNRNLMQWRVDSGLISQEQADIMNEMYPHYVPTFRNVSGTAGSRVLQGGVQVANTVRKATGSNKDILPIDASMARQTMQTVQAAKRNLLGNRLLNDVLNNKEKVAEYVQAVEKTSEKTDLAEEMDNAKDSNLDLNNTFKIFRNGETYLMQVNNGIYEGLKSISSEIDNTDTNVLLKPVKAANNMFKKLITGYSPMFTIKNFARDIQDSGLYAKELRKFVKKYPKTYTQMIGNGELWQLYKSLGGTGSSFFDYDSGIEKAIDSKNKLGTKIKDSTVGKIENLNMMIEQAPRFAEFMATIEKAGNQNYDTLMEAMLNAADITVNFGRSGTWGNFLNSTFVPFFNPSIQGFDKMGRTFLEGKAGKQFAKLAIRATLLGIAPTLINELLLGDDDDYENLSDRDKDTNFIIKLGDNKWLKIPKGRVLSIFGNTASRVLKTMRGEEWDVGEFLKTQADQTAPISPFDSNIVSPIMAVQNNKTWYGSKIVPQRLEGYAPKDQYDEKTDAFSKWLGGKINYSPKKINYLIDAYTGIIGDVALPLTTPKAETNPFTKAFVIDGVTNNEISNDFYNMLDEYNPKQSNKESAKEVTRYLNKQSTQVSDINKQIREIENSNLSNAEKKKQVRELRELINTIELTAMATVPQYEKAVDKYKGTFADEEVDSDYAYLFANRDIFGAEYAVKTFSKSLYNNHKDENMETFFRNYFTREYFQKKLEPEKKSTNALPTLSNKTTNTRQLPKLSNNQNKQLPKLQK